MINNSLVKYLFPYLLRRNPFRPIKNFDLPYCFGISVIFLSLNDSQAPHHPFLLNHLSSRIDPLKLIRRTMTSPPVMYKQF